MPLTILDKEKIALIDSQVKFLQDKSASDSTILNTLADFVIDTARIVEGCEAEELNQQLRSYNGFSYFLSLISLAMTE